MLSRDRQRKVTVYRETDRLLGQVWRVFCHFCGPLPNWSVNRSATTKLAWGHRGKHGWR